MRMRHACSCAWMTEPPDPQGTRLPPQFQPCDYAVKAQRLGTERKGRQPGVCTRLGRPEGRTVRAACLLTSWAR
jgi:hypothetical protein